MFSFTKVQFSFEFRCLKNATSTCDAHCSPEVKRTLDHGHPSGAQRIQLEAIHFAGTGAGVLAEIATLPPTLPNYTVFKEKLAAMTDQEYSPTLNIIRGWCAHFALKNLVAGLIKEWVSALQWWCVAAVESDELACLNIEQPVLGNYLPTAEDEENAGKTATVNASATCAEKMLTEKSAAFDACTLRFPSWYIEAWGNDAVYDALANSMAKAVEIFEAWTADKANKHQPTDVGPAALLALEAVDSFAVAYAAVAGDKIFTTETHTAYTSVFASSAAKAMPGMKTLIVAAKRSTEFKAKEIKTVSVAGAELEFGAVFMTALEDSKLTGAESMSTDRVGEIINGLKKFKFRPGATRGLTDNLAKWIIAAVDTFHDPASGTDWQGTPGDSLAVVKTFLKFMDEFAPEDPHHIEEFAKKKLLCTETAELLQDLQASAQVRDIAADPNHEAIGTTGFDSLFIKLGDSAAVLKPELEAIIGSVIARLIEQMQNDEVDVKMIDRIHTNYQTIAPRCKTIGVSGVLDEKLVEKLIKKATALADAGFHYNEDCSKTTWNNLNKAMAEWKQTRIPDTSVAEIKDLAKAAILWNKKHFIAFSSKTKEILEKLKTDLQATIKDYSKISQGLRDGTSWLEGVKDNADIQDLIKHASKPKGLLSGPGAKVGGAKDHIDKVGRKVHIKKLSRKLAALSQGI